MSTDAALAKFVEKQMRNWEIARRQRHAVEEANAASEKDVAPFVTVSRAVGARGDETARELAQRLDWPFFDREILSHMSEDDVIRKHIYEKMDQHDASWLEGVMRHLLQGDYRREDYFTRLSETVLSLARQGSGVFLGRGADLLLPQDQGLRVRFIAPYQQRLEAYAKKHDCDPVAARSGIEREERERETLFAKHFGKAKDEPTRFDLIVNLGRVLQDEAIDIILAALRSRGVDAR